MARRCLSEAGSKELPRGVRRDAARQGGGMSLLCGALLALCCAAALMACGESPTYELRWTLGCTSGLGPCEVTSVRDCSIVGIGAIEVDAQQESSGKRSVFACFAPPDGPVGLGPDLGEGNARLTVLPLSSAGLRFAVEPTRAIAEIPAEGVVQVTVDLPVPPACSDGVDNDGDVQVDSFDLQCEDDQDTDEAE